jgi:hypothetical protein
MCKTKKIHALKIYSEICTLSVYLAEPKDILRKRSKYFQDTQTSLCGVKIKFWGGFEDSCTKQNNMWYQRNLQASKVYSASRVA